MLCFRQAREVVCKEDTGWRKMHTHWKNARGLKSQGDILPEDWGGWGLGIEGRFDVESATLEDVGVDHGCFYVFVAE